VLIVVPHVLLEPFTVGLVILIAIMKSFA